MIDARVRVERVLAAGARIADPADPLGREARARLRETSGLTPQGVALALDEHLERGASPAELDAFVARATPARRAVVVLSANVCTAALRAIAFGCATAADVLTRPSRRDPVVAELVARARADDAAFAAAGGRVALTRDEIVEPRAGDEVHVYGGDDAIAAYRRRLPAGASLRAHGPGFGAALVGAEADPVDAACALARDVVPFDQRGCL
ncbi:MAG TPA: acyl-CoA reductase, partial [Minicystis sp.]|nr:acyl-CoA reductase [Minicystis sp.]